jgi:hypothetical protein
MIRDTPPIAVDVEAFFSVPGGRDALEMTQEACLELWLGQPVHPPHDHRGPADHTVGDPAVLVLVMPLRHSLGAAQQALVRH